MNSAATPVKPFTVRDNNGQYAISKMDRVCKCGARLGAHAAAKPRDCDETDCAGFKAARPEQYRAG